MIRIANAPCSWGVIEGIGGQRDGYRRVIDEMQETGYTGTELGDWGFMPTDPDELRHELDSRGLALVGSWVSVRLEDRACHAQSAADAVRTGRQLARVGGPNAVVVLGNDPYGNPHRTRIAGRVTPADAMTEDQWKVFAEGANLVARRVMDEAGIRTVIHQHIGTLIETEAEARRLFELTDPSVLGLCLDTGHYFYGGGDPAAAARRWRDRIWHLHLKDVRPAVLERVRAHGIGYLEAVSRGVFCPLGEGGVDLAGVLKELAGFDGWAVYEQDVDPSRDPSRPVESAARSREYLRGKGD